MGACLSKGKKIWQQRSRKDDKRKEQEMAHSQMTQAREQQPLLPVPVPLPVASSSGANNLVTSSSSLEMKAKKQRDASNIPSSLQIFTFDEIVATTKNFSEDKLLGEGGFGSVYKGNFGTGQDVAIKRLDKSSLQGIQEYQAEVNLLSRVVHPNLVKIIGCCEAGEERLLVYQYMPLGSVHDHLHDRTGRNAPLDWHTRMNIAAGVARGLTYLHTEVNPPIIYRDLKPANILLDNGFHPKLSDFGLARLGPTGDKTHVTTRIMGSEGYCDPQYYMTGKLKLASDIYTFGVVLLELISGRKPWEYCKPRSEQDTVRWARSWFQGQRTVSRLVDPKLRGQYPMRELCRALALAFCCATQETGPRPHIKVVRAAISAIEADSQAFNPGAAPLSRRDQPVNLDHRQVVGEAINWMKSFVMNQDAEAL